MNLQQPMSLPELTTSKAFYLRQLWFYNFGIHLVTSGGEKPVMQTWTEDFSSSSSEIASRVYNFVNICPEVENKTHMMIWSDSCADQNNNLVCLHQLLILQYYWLHIFWGEP